jgi:SAM-dependent methyltransferase
MRSAPPTTPDWLFQVLGVERPDEDGIVELHGARFVMRGGLLRAERLAQARSAQGQTAEAFGFKWDRRETFESPASRARMREWLVERYGDVAGAAWWREYDEPPLVLDAGCGAALSALELLGPIVPTIRYVGVDISSAVDVAAARFAERRLPGAFLQADITDPPFASGSIDVIFSEGVLHHTDSTETALKRLADLLSPGGRFLFYVYRRKGPIREFTDDYVRERVGALDPEDAWQAIMPITRLGKALGELDAEVDVEEPIEFLGLPAGRINVQRLFYWHVLKAFYRPDLTLEELNHINYDWFAPGNAHRHRPEEVRAWCEEAGLEVERESIQPAGITIVARKREPRPL